MEKMIVCPQCGEGEIYEDDGLCVFCYEEILEDGINLMPPVDDPGVRCDCEDYPACGC